ncbi:MAG: Mrp family chromosome partitioning ATPase [Kiritimatiellia bacterium]|jgi:polysaccharide biosynthesis transport protein
MTAKTYGKLEIHPRCMRILDRARTGGVLGRLLSAASGTLPKTLLVTSPGRADGKTTASLALARAVVEAGRTVLWIDAHASAPAGSEFFDETAAPGLVEWLNGSCKLSELPELEAPTGLTVCLQSVATSPSVLHQAPWQERLAAAAQRFDVVVVDGGDLSSDSIPVMLAPLVDGVILVARCRRTQTNALSDAQNRLNNVKAKVLGVMLNRRTRTLPPWMSDEA